MSNFRSEADHQVAFEEYYNTRSYHAAARKVKAEYKTVQKWANEDFPCQAHCPWHGWPKLIEERQQALQAKIDLIQSGNFDLSAHERAVADVVEPSNVAASSTMARRRAVETLVRSDLECISHFEFLYNKVFFEATGLPLGHSGLLAHCKDTEGKELRIQSENLTLEQLNLLYDKSGLKCTNLSSAIKSMVEIREHIDKLRESLGVKKKPLIAPEEHQHSDSEILPGVEDRQLSIEDLRQFRDLVEKTPPDQLDLMLRVMKVDEEQVQAILNSDPDARPSIPITVAS